MLVFAFGVGRGGSIVARRPLGVTAALVLALWPFAERALTWAMPFDEGTTEFYQGWGYVSLTVKIAAAVVLVVQIARAGVVTGRLRWAPAWALAAVVVPQVLAQVLVIAMGIDLCRTELDGLDLLFGLGQLASFAAPVTSASWPSSSRNVARCRPASPCRSIRLRPDEGRVAAAVPSSAALAENGAPARTLVLHPSSCVRQNTWLGDETGGRRRANRGGGAGSAVRGRRPCRG